MRLASSLPLLALALAACTDEPVEKKVLAPATATASASLTAQSLGDGVSTVCAANVKARDAIRAAVKGTEVRSASQQDELTALDAMVDDTCN